jgi:hypothetical protein
VFLVYEKEGKVMKIPTLSDDQYNRLNDELLPEIRNCKKDNNCRNLTRRGFYFEPNKHTIKKWQQESFYKEEGLTKREIKRAIFVCESPGPGSPVEQEDIEVKRCWGKENTHNKWTSLRNLDRFPIRQNGYAYSNIFKNCYITNIVKCGPRPKNTIHHGYEEIEKCSEWLKKEIEIIQPFVVIAVGEEAYNFLRGKHYKDFIESKGIKLYKIYHYSHRRNDQGSLVNRCVKSI